MEELCYSSFLALRVGGWFHLAHKATLDSAPPNNLVFICDMGIPCPRPTCELIWVSEPTD